MRMYRGKPRRARFALAATVVALATAGSAAAFQALPPGSQVNDDPAAGINKALSVSGEDPTNADVVGGALDRRQARGPVGDLPPAGGERICATRCSRARLRTARGRLAATARWAAGRARPRQFAWVAELRPGPGWRGVRRSTSPARAGPSRGRRGTRTRRGTGFDNNNVFASSFDNTGDANQGKWIFAGQSRGNGGSGPNVPSLNIHTEQNAENPVGGRRFRGRPDQARPMGDVAGDLEQQPPRIRSSSASRSVRAWRTATA